jgi:hypothetical protein
MRVQLGLIALTGFAVSVVCLSGAYALNGGMFTLGGFDRPRCDFGQAASGVTTRSLPWDDNNDQATISLPANVHYQAGQGDQLVIKGDPRIVAHVRVNNGVVNMDCRSPIFFGHDRMDVTLPGRHFDAFEVTGTGNLQLAGLSQPNLRLEVSGAGHINADAKVQAMNVDVSGEGGITVNGQADRLHVEISGEGDVVAKGRADALRVDINGEGDLRAGELAVKSADLEISGDGKIEIAPQDSLDAQVTGDGTITLKTEPKNLTSDFGGDGKLVHPDGRVEGRHHHEHHDS